MLCKSVKAVKTLDTHAAGIGDVQPMLTTVDNGHVIMQAGEVKKQRVVQVYIMYV